MGFQAGGARLGSLGEALTGSERAGALLNGAVSNGAMIGFYGSQVQNLQGAISGERDGWGKFVFGITTMAGGMVGLRGASLAEGEHAFELNRMDAKADVDAQLASAKSLSGSKLLWEGGKEIG